MSSETQKQPQNLPASALAEREGRPARPWVLIASLVLLWTTLIYQVGGQWSVYEQYAYGWAVPFLCLYLLWGNWKDRPAPLPPRVHKRAIGILTLAALLLLPTRVIVEANPIWRAASYLIAFEVIAATLAIVYLAGGKSWLRHFAFAIGFFLVAIPWPSGLEGAVIQFLTRLNTGATIELLGVFGVPALQHGNVIEISSGMVGIDEACSGVRSVQTTLMMTLFFGALNRLPTLRRFALLGGGLLLAVVCNLGRTFFLAWIASRDGIAAVDRWHDPAGVTILVTCFFGIWGLAELLQRQVGRVTPCAPSTGNSAILQNPPVAPDLSVSASQHFSFSNLFVLLFAWLILIVVVTEGWFRLHEHKAGSEAAWSVAFPKERRNFREIEMTKIVRDQLQCNEAENYSWREADGTAWQSFYLQWFTARTLKERITVHLAKTHRPEHCLAAAGKVLEEQTAPKILRLDGLELPYRGLVFNDRGVKLHVFFVAWEEGTPQGVYANMRSDTASRLAAAWSGSRGKGQRVIEVAAWGHPDFASAEVAFEKLMREIVTVQSLTKVVGRDSVEP